MKKFGTVNYELLDCVLLSLCLSSPVFSNSKDILSCLPIFFCCIHSHLQILIFLPACKKVLQSYSLLINRLYTVHFSPQNSLFPWFICFLNGKDSLQFVTLHAHIDISQLHCSSPQIICLPQCHHALLLLPHFI